MLPRQRRTTQGRLSKRPPSSELYFCHQPWTVTGGRNSQAGLGEGVGKGMGRERKEGLRSAPPSKKTSWLRICGPDRSKILLITITFISGSPLLPLFVVHTFLNDNRTPCHDVWLIGSYESWTKSHSTKGHKNTTPDKRSSDKRPPGLFPLDIRPKKSRASGCTVEKKYGRRGRNNFHFFTVCRVILLNNSKQIGTLSSTHGK